jgi:tRNA(fMet)-specific endonuclease VapC
VSLLYLLDADVVSEPLRPAPRLDVVRKLRRHRSEVAIASVVWHELRHGMELLPPSRGRSAIEDYLENVVLRTMPILDYDHAAADWHARERARLQRRGLTPPFHDGQIAATARTQDLTLVTFNVKDFKRFDSLRVVAWG